MYDYMKALQKRFDRQSHPELDTQVKKNCGGTWTPRGAESCSACWTHRTHCWLNPS